MITINLGKQEYFNPNTQEFTYEDLGVIRFEYSLRAIYEWEGKWLKPFLSNNLQMTEEESTDFYMRMALDPISEKHLTPKVKRMLRDYITSPSTATVFNQHGDRQNGNKNNGKVLTSEEIYAMMAMTGVPIEFENRNINRLMVMLRIISTKNSPDKMSKRETLKQNAKLNAQRKAKYNTRG